VLLPAQFPNGLSLLIKPVSDASPWGRDRMLCGLQAQEKGPGGKTLAVVTSPMCPAILSSVLWSACLTVALQWFFAILPAAWFLWRLAAWRRQTSPGLCSNCGYDLRATPDRCPECGVAPKISQATRPSFPPHMLTYAPSQPAVVNHAQEIRANESISTTNFRRHPGGASAPPPRKSSMESSCRASSQSCGSATSVCTAPSK
jgi:hypothetical protein